MVYYKLLINFCMYKIDSCHSVSGLEMGAFRVAELRLNTLRGLISLMLLLAHDLVADLEDDAGGLLAEEQALAELATVVLLIEE